MDFSHIFSQLAAQQDDVSLAWFLFFDNVVEVCFSGLTDGLKKGIIFEEEVSGQRKLLLSEMEMTPVFLINGLEVEVH